MRSRRSVGRLAAVVFTGAIVFAGCTDNGSDGGQTSGGSEASEASDGGGHGGMEHPMDGGPAPEGMAAAEDPEFPVGTEVTLTADHMEGMEGATATISGAFDTTTYSVSFTRPMAASRSLTTSGSSTSSRTRRGPLAEGTEVVITADHWRVWRVLKPPSTVPPRRPCTWSITRPTEDDDEPQVGRRGARSSLRDDHPVEPSKCARLLRGWAASSHRAAAAAIGLDRCWLVPRSWSPVAGPAGPGPHPSRVIRSCFRNMASLTRTRTRSSTGSKRSRWLSDRRT